MGYVSSSGGAGHPSGPLALGPKWCVVILPSMTSSQLVMRTVSTPSLCRGTSLPVQLYTGHPSVCVAKSVVTILFTWLYLHSPSICTVNSSVQ